MAPDDTEEVGSGEVTKADGSKVDVIVDAGNAKVLAQKVDDDHDEKNGHDANETNETGPETPDPSAPATTRVTESALHRRI